MTDTHRIETYSEFWPYYLRAHSKAETRAVHLSGTAVATVALFAMFVSGNPWFIPAALIGGYAPAWFAHAFLERNRPATFRYPLWSLACEYRMAWAWLSGQIDDELEKAGIAER